MNRDRGNIKWTSLMLPEHLLELRKWTNEDAYTERPELNEWDFQLIQEELELAIKRKGETLIKTWFDGEIIEHQGIIVKIDTFLKAIVLEETSGIRKIPVVAIINVQCMTID
ncbi:YolD-like family protein [Sporosarcina siberiensis]|uniref:YolD-like family protein n=1 Tax=Sporosarcina siberiensis TaxID=1365606 RepID=A0ABW4SI52_9BACL